MSKISNISGQRFHLRIVMFHLSALTCYWFNRMYGKHQKNFSILHFWTIGRVCQNSKIMTIITTNFNYFSLLVCFLLLFAGYSHKHAHEGIHEHVSMKTFPRRFENTRVANLFIAECSHRHGSPGHPLGSTNVQSYFLLLFDLQGNWKMLFPSRI